MTFDLSTVIRVQASWTTTSWGTPSFTTLSDVAAVSWSTNRRSGGHGGRTGPSRASIRLRNESGEYEPDNPASSIGANLKRWKPIRIQSSDDAGATWMSQWTGFLWDAVPEATAHAATTTLECVDSLAALARFTLPDTVLADQWSGDRVQSILTAVGWPALYTGTIDNGTVRCPAGTFTGNAFSVLSDVATAEGGLLWVAGNGKVEFRDRFEPVTSSVMNTSQVTIDDAWMDYAVVPQTLGGFAPVTRATVTPASGTTQTFDATASNYPPDSEDIHGAQVQYDADGKELAESWVKGHGFAGQFPNQISIHTYPDNQTALTAMGDSSVGTAQINLWHRVALTFKPKGWAADQAIDCVVEGVEHDVSLNAGWTATVHLSPYATDWRNESGSLYTFGSTVGSSSGGGPLDILFVSENTYSTFESWIESLGHILTVERTLTDPEVTSGHDLIINAARNFTDHGVKYQGTNGIPILWIGHHNVIAGCDLWNDEFPDVNETKLRYLSDADVVWPGKTDDSTTQYTIATSAAAVGYGVAPTGSREVNSRAGDATDRVGWWIPSGTTLLDSVTVTNVPVGILCLSTGTDSLLNVLNSDGHSLVEAFINALTA